MKPLHKLKLSYKAYKKSNLKYSEYLTIRLFCIECELLTFNEIELMEYEVNIEVNNSLSF